MKQRETDLEQTTFKSWVKPCLKPFISFDLDSRQMKPTGDNKYREREVRQSSLPPQRIHLPQQGQLFFFFNWSIVVKQCCVSFRSRANGTSFTKYHGLDGLKNKHSFHPVLKA